VLPVLPKSAGQALILIRAAGEEFTESRLSLAGNPE
jgi:hypothetical protein